MHIGSVGVQCSACVRHVDGGVDVTNRVDRLSMACFRIRFHLVGLGLGEVGHQIVMPDSSVVSGCCGRV
jgi:hypothetical protein